jgi:hypothetical protein
VRDERAESNAAVFAHNEAIQQRYRKNLKLVQDELDPKNDVDIFDRSIEIGPVPATHGARLRMLTDVDVALNRMIQTRKSMPAALGKAELFHRTSVDVERVKKSRLPKYAESDIFGGDSLVAP